MPSDSTLFHVGLQHFLVLGAVLFSIGIIGVMLRRNVIVVLMSIELMLNAVNLTFVAFSHYTNNVNGQVLVFFVMTLAAAEAAVGLALAVQIFKRFSQINIRYFDKLKG